MRAMAELVRRATDGTLAMTVAGKIEQGEGRKIEFKRELPSALSLSRTAVAFANGAGGCIIVGVQDDGTVCGIPPTAVSALVDRACNVVYDRCSPTIMTETYTEQVMGATVLVIEVFPGAQKPYFLSKPGRREGVYIRSGASNRQADREMIAELERQCRNVSYDAELLHELGPADLDLDGLKTDFLSATGTELADQDLQNLGLFRHEGSQVLPTVAGVLLAGRRPLSGYCGIKCARFKGTTMTEFIDKKEFTGPLYQVADSALAFAKTHIALRAHIEGIRRVERYEVPILAIREAILNAIVHRDYSISGSDIKLAIFDDIVEITSPGVLPKSLDITDIVAGRSEIRNRVIARFFEKMGLIEQWGTGIRKMLESCRDYGLPAPTFAESGLFFQVTFQRSPAAVPRAFEVRERADAASSWGQRRARPSARVVRGFSRSAGDKDAAVLALVRQAPGLRTPQLSRRLGIPRRTLERVLKRLREAGWIEYSGSQRTGGYRACWG